MVPVEGKAPVARLWCEVTFFDFAGWFSLWGQGLPSRQGRAKKAAGHRRPPPLQPGPATRGVLLLQAPLVPQMGRARRLADGGRWRQPCSSVSPDRTDRDQHPTFLHSLCFPKLDGTVQAARELQAVQAVMFLKAKLDNADWTHTRAEEENYEDAMKIIQALKERHGEDIDFMAPSTVPTGPATDIFAPVEGGEARPTDRGKGLGQWRSCVLGPTVSCLHPFNECLPCARKRSTC